MAIRRVVLGLSPVLLMIVISVAGCGEKPKPAAAATTASAVAVAAPAESANPTVPSAATSSAPATSAPVTAPAAAETPGPQFVDGPQVANSVSTQLTAVVGQAPDSVTCPDDLPATVQASIRCSLVSGSDSYGVTVTTTSVEGTNVEFDIRVDDQPS